jgi:hypothetical protein
LDINGNVTTNKAEYVVDPKSNHVLAALRDTHIATLDEKMDTLTVGDMFAYEIYETKADAHGDEHFVDANGNVTSDPKKYVIADDANPILVHLKDKPINQMSEAVAELTVGEIFEDEIYETKVDTNGNKYFVDENGNKTENPEEYVLKGSWYYLLKDTRETVNGQTNPNYKKVHTDYKLTDEMDDIIQNMTDNMQHAPLYELLEKGVVNLSENTTLLAEDDNGLISYNIPHIVYNEYGNPTGFTTTELEKYKDATGKEITHFRDLNVSQLFDYVGKLVGLLHA